MATNKTDLKKYFQTGDKPTQTEYEQLIDAVRHVNDKLPIADVESLQGSLDAKAAAATLLNHINDDSVHGNQTLDGADIKLAYEAEADTNAFTDSEKQQVADSEAHKNDSTVHVLESDKNLWKNKLSIWKQLEVLYTEMGEVYRIHNGSVYKFIGDYNQILDGKDTYTTTDFSQELIDNKWKLLLAGVSTAHISSFSPEKIGANKSYEIFVTGWDFDRETEITLKNKTIENPDLIVTNLNVVSPNGLTFFTTSNTTLDDYDIIVKTKAGTYVHPTTLKIRTESVLYPTALNWTVHEGGASEIAFDSGVIRPNSLNQVRRTGYFDAFEENEAFEVIFKFYYPAISGGTISTDVEFGINKGDNTTFNSRHSIDHLYGSKLIGGSIYTYDNVVINTGFQSGSIDTWRKFKRDPNGLISYCYSDDKITWISINTLSETYTGPVRVWYVAPKHSGVEGIELIKNY
jgi:hypothetical protein